MQNRIFLPTFDGSSTNTKKSWRKKLGAFFQLHTVAEGEVDQIAALHLEGEAKDWWFIHLKLARVTAYVDVTQRTIKKFDRRKLNTLSIETFPIIDEKVHEKKKEDFSTITQEREKLPPPPAA